MLRCLLRLLAVLGLTSVLAESYDVVEEDAVVHRPTRQELSRRQVLAARDAHLAGHDQGPLETAVLLATDEVSKTDQPELREGTEATKLFGGGQHSLHEKGQEPPHIHGMYAFSWSFVVGVLICGGIPAAIFWPHFAVPAAVQAVVLGLVYIILSAVMIETNRYLMQPGRFPYPFMLTMNHMSVSFVLASGLCQLKPSFFPALENLKVTPNFLWRFVPIGVPFAASLVCSNWAYKYLSVSFLQIMKQSNIVTIYVFSLIAGLEALRRCNVILLAFILLGASLGVKGEMHFVLGGFILQCISSLCEACKVIMQSLLMSGQAKLDPLTMVLFMAPACFLANLLPLFFLEGEHMNEIVAAFKAMWPVLLGNSCLAFLLNVTVAQCIKQLSAVGYLLCGIVKDTAIIVTSTWLLGETLTLQQQIGFTMALTGVALYSLYKQNVSLFAEDNLLEGFRRVYGMLTERAEAKSGSKETSCLSGLPVRSTSGSTA